MVVRTRPNGIEPELLSKYDSLTSTSYKWTGRAWHFSQQKIPSPIYTAHRQSPIIPIAMTGPSIQPDAPTPSPLLQPGLDGPASTTTGPTIYMPTIPAMPDTDPEILPNDHAIAEPPDVQQPVGHTPPRPERARRPPRRLVEEM